MRYQNEFYYDMLISRTLFLRLDSLTEQRVSFGARHVAVADFIYANTVLQ
jgi:hypothetical protein